MTSRGPTPPAGERPAGARGPRRGGELSPERARLIRAVARLRDELVSGDGRSPSVRLRHTRVRYAFDLCDLDALAPGQGARALAQFRAGRAARLVDAAAAGTRDEAARIARKLVALSREDRLRTDESGARDLAVGHPFVWGRAGAYLFRAPLLLHPAEIDRDDRGARNVSLRPRRDAPVALNDALLRLVFQKKGFALSEDVLAALDELAEDPDRGAEAVLAELATLGLSFERRGTALAPLPERAEVTDGEAPDRLVVEECAVLGLFPQSGSDLLPDYDGLIEALQDPAVDALSLLAAAAQILPPALRAALETAAAARPAQAAQAAPSAQPAPPTAAPLVPVVHADPSQRAVLAAARDAAALVVDGPPGTGKSQVIVNLVADAIGRGLRVAVVSEKRAALDVVAQRLDAVGLREVSALVHDVREDRRALFDQLAQRLDGGNHRARRTRPDPLPTVAEAEELSRALEARHAALARVPPAAGLGVGRLHALASAAGAALDLSGADGLHRLDRAGLARLLADATALHPFADLLAPADGDPWSHPQGSSPRASLAALDARALRALETDLAAAHAAALAHDEALARSPVPAPAAERARFALQAAVAARPARAEPDDGSLFVEVLRAGAADARALDLLDAAGEAWSAREDAVRRVGARVEMEVTPGLERAVALLRAWSGRFVRFFLLAWWSARSLLRRELIAQWPERSAGKLDAALLADVADRITAARAWRALDACANALGLRARLGNAAERAGAVLARLVAVSRQARTVAAARNELLAAGAWPGAGGAVTAADVEAWDRDVDARVSLLSARDALRRALEPVARYFPWLASPPAPHGELPAAPALAALLEAFRRDGERVAEFDRLLAAAAAHHPEGPSLFRALSRALAGAGSGAHRRALAGAWARAWVQRLSREDPAVAALDAPLAPGDEDATGAALRALWARAAGEERARVRAACAEHPLLGAPPAEKGKRRTAEQVARDAMLHECTKQRRLMPLRGFVRRFAGDGLLDILPVWLLSPETMAVLFPRVPLFDLVVFDEASQCTVESGLPVLLRARRLVVAGDDRQMPPAAFFSPRAGEGDEGGDAGEGDADARPAQGGPAESEEAAGEGDDRGPAPADALEAESLLTLARARLPHEPLRWHYRCREEELIAFSNHAMYGASLLTIPSTATRHSPPALRWVPVANARYQAGRNEQEARRVVDVLHEVLGRAGGPSVGVVTFNVQQRQAVLDAVDARRESDPEFARRFDAAQARARVDDRPFVKNLENVQGDERDVIVFSPGHAAGAGKHRVAARFGPISQRGGERRLNVAVSRARAECVVVASFEPEALSVQSALHRGPVLLKAFLEFAHHLSGGRREQAEAVLRAVGSFAGAGAGAGAGPAAGNARAEGRDAPEGYVPLCEQVARGLRARGLGAETWVGSSGFRVPVAAFDPSRPERYRVAVLCDEGDDEGDAFERHVQHSQALEARGWRVLRVDARAFYRAPGVQLDRVERAVREGPSPPG